MSTAGTLYDKEIRLGHAKLLSSVNLAGAANCFFSSAVITPQFDVYYIDLQKVRGQPDSILNLYVSDDNGATVKYANYWASAQYSCSHSTAGGAVGYPLNAGDTPFRITLGLISAGHNVAGDITFYRPIVAGYNPCFTWHTTTIQDNTFLEVTCFGGGFCANINVNGILIQANPTPFVDGFIRLYGLRRGV